MTWNARYASKVDDVIKSEFAEMPNFLKPKYQIPKQEFFAYLDMKIVID